MNDNSTYYTSLITRYFSGEIQEEELRLLSEWIKSDAENEKLFVEYRNTWQLIEEQKIKSAININSEWNELQMRLGNGLQNTEKAVPVRNLGTESKGRIFSFRMVSRVAAALAVLLVASFLLYTYFTKPTEIVITAQATSIERKLPDGSLVSLYPGSELSYTDNFTSEHRNVTLKGEAYFKVVHDEARPFVVSVGESRVEVLGTQFNVNTSTASGNMEVVLTSGKVSVYFNGNPKQNTVLVPGEKAVVKATEKQIEKMTNADANYMAWKTLELEFNNQPLAEVAATLSKVYHTQILLTDDAIGNCRVTSSFSKQSLESVLNVMKQTLDLQIKKNGNRYEISGKPCP